MPRKRVVGPASRAASAPPPDARADYRAMLESELGAPSFGYNDAERPEPSDFLQQIARLAVIGVLAFVVTLGWRLHDAGALRVLWSKPPPPVERYDTSWMRGAGESKPAPQVTPSATADVDAGETPSEGEAAEVSPLDDRDAPQ